MAVKIFFCYAHEDEELLKKLQAQLKPFQRSGLIDVWHDRDISAGTEWEREISHHLNTADIILLLVSPDFMDSDYCYSVEMKRAKERHRRGEATVIPVILYHVHWQGELGELQALPKDAEPVTSDKWPSLNAALYDVAKGVRKAAEEILSAAAEEILSAASTSSSLLHERRGIEQLWYTWSNVGLDTIRAGFRIRAASEGLSNILDEHVRNLDRYQHYLLPRGARLVTRPDMAPVSLAFIATEQGRILVHKEYTGRDAFGRDSVFFTHLLDNLPENFSARDAILLWGSDFWQNSDASLENRFSTRLPLISCEKWEALIERLRKEQDQKPPEGTSIDPQWIEKQLAYLVWTYLIKKPHIDSATGLATPEPIYIAAPDSDIALLISGLTHCLPEQLVRNLTFSTFESDVAEATTEIVGTCWLSVPDARQDPHVASLLSEKYQEKLALNCYTGWQTQLENHPLVQHRPVALQCAQQAAQYFLYGDMEYEAFLETFLEDRKESSNLTIDEFLKRYEREIVRGQDPSREDIELVLSSSDYLYVARMLSKEGYKKGVLTLALSIPGWWSDFARKRLENLYKHSKEIPRLVQALSQLARYALPYATNIIKAGVVQAQIPAAPETLTTEHPFAVILSLIYTIAPPEADPDVWLALLEALRPIPNILVFFDQHWNFYARLMGIWARLLPSPLSERDYQQVQPLLAPLSWNRFGDFLALNLPLAWNEKVTATLVSQSASALSQSNVYNLEKNFHTQIENLLRQLSQEAKAFIQQGTAHQLPPGTQPWKTAGQLFKILVDSHYKQTLPLLFRLLDSAMGQQEKIAERLLNDAQLTVFNDVVAFLKGYGPRYLPSSGKNAQTVLRWFDILAKGDDPIVKVSKLDVLLTWLASPQLAAWLDQSPQGEEHLAKLLLAARLDMPEIETFFQGYGQKYLRLYPSSRTLLDLFERYARTQGELRLSILFDWLNLAASQETVEELLRAAHLTRKEEIWFIERYGELYLRQYPKSPVLLTYVSEYLQYIQTADLDIFASGTAPEKPSTLEMFLLFLLNSSLLNPDSQLVIYDWYQVAAFVRMPALFNSQIAESIARLLKTGNMSLDKRGKLLKILTTTCLEHELPIDLMETLLRKLSPVELSSLLDDIAQTAREGILQQQYPKTLYLSAIQFALTFKTFFPETDQDTFVLRFLGTLLQGVSENTFKWFDKEVKKAKKRFLNLPDEWQRYRNQLYSTVVVPSPPGENWWQRFLALLQE